ncbi:hypothetical protein FMEXI_5425 [Fusarium mexicanum]|uniref:Uncharacterized protein n=1 Tax=Fusarium mexicanum TaxID=751941 RepID=A0A8H5J3N0_9HYPO|nr:hypothetical protein FMEXI_5425 [Fusarium mexicanum]
MRSDYDVTNLMFGADTAAELDFYQGEPKPRLEPLLLDTVMQGRPPVSNCRLLQMPNEILAKIVSFVAEDKDALQQLALVDSDCCGLSRASQFSEFRFDYSPNKIRLLLLLAQGMIGQDRPGILDCIRKFTFKPDPSQVRDIHPYIWRRFQEDPDEEYGGAAEIKEQGARHFKQIQHDVALNFKAMRNLETLVWDCNFPLDKDTWSLLACSTAHNLLINGTLIAENFSLGPPLTTPSWPLRSLVLMNVRLNPEAWKPLSLGTDSKSFPKLRQLRIKPGRDAIDEASFASLLSAPLKSLEPSHSSFRLFEHQIRSRIEEPYLDLEELVIELTENPQLATELILKHNSLKKLWVAQNYYMSGRDNSLDRVLIPGLGKGRFNNLRSLYVQFGGQNKDAGYDKDHFYILPESLATICELTTLEQLGLRCDEMEYESYSYEDYTGVTFPIWLIDHGKLQAHLQSLKNLKMLVIRGDTYPSRAGEDSSHTGYYRQAYANPEDFQTAEDHPELGPFVQERGESRVAWQHAHLYRMLEHARSYRAMLPKLEWILCGKRPMRFIEDAQGVVQPHPVGNEMDECKTFIGRVFGLASEVEIAHLTN